MSENSRPGGSCQIATPDLQEMVRDYAEQRIHPDWEKFGLGWTANRCERFNIGMRWWGHQWMYDEEELTRLARMVGLVRCCLIGESDLPMFLQPRIPGVVDTDSRTRKAETPADRRCAAAGEHHHSLISPEIF